jgi:4-hydroxy-2-oxoheptanedioate aldolase
LFGCFLSLGSAAVAEIVGAAGYDFAVIDLEHGVGNERDAYGQMQALEAAGCGAVVRVESKEPLRAQRVLDYGAHGVMFPRVESAEEARAAVAAVRYTAHGGARGLASTVRACGFGVEFAEYLEGARELLTVVQIESPKAVEEAGEIAAVEGVDVLFVGPFDLSFAMGMLGKFDAPEFVAAVERVGRAAGEAGKAAGILLPAGKGVGDYAGRGYRVIVQGSDAGILKEGLRVAVRGLRG